MTDFTIRLHAGGCHPRAPVGTLLIETTHRSEASAHIEIAAAKERQRRGEVGQVTLIDHRPGVHLNLTNENLALSEQVRWSWVKT